MKAKSSFVLAALASGLFWAAAPGAALAEGGTSTLHAEMREVCAEQGGRFEQSWRYNDQGVQWGRVVSCTTNAGNVTCQNDVCRTSRQTRAVTQTASKGPDTSDDNARIPSHSAAITGALVALSLQ